MTCIDAKGKYFKTLNEEIRATADADLTIENLMGQRYIGAGIGGKSLLLYGVPGNDLGCYLNGGTIRVAGNAQDQTGDTMNAGAILVEGSSGDATGYAMRGGKIFVQGNAGYRVGIHMKAYKDQQPVIVVGGETGSFLGEYQAGGTIIVLGLHSGGRAPVGSLCCAGMHGGRMFLRCRELPPDLPQQVNASRATPEDLASIDGYLDDFCKTFGMDKQPVLNDPFFLITPNTKNPYKSLYTFN